MQKDVVLQIIGVFLSASSLCVGGAYPHCSLWTSPSMGLAMRRLSGVFGSFEDTACNDCFNMCLTNPDCSYYIAENDTSVTSMFIPKAFNCPAVSFGIAISKYCGLSNDFNSLYSKVPAENCNECQSLCVADTNCVFFNFHYGDLSTEETPKTDTSVCLAFASGVGDPHFSGFNGSPFEYHGHDGAVVNVYSDAALQVNAELSSFGIHGMTFMKSIGVKAYPPCNTFMFTSVPIVEDGIWIARVESRANGHVYNGSSKWTSAEGGITLKQISTTDGSFDVILSTPLYQIRVRKENKSLHLDLGMKLLTVVSPLSAHGILGQTLGWKAGGEPSLAGDESSYIVSGIFEDNFAFNMFHATCA